MTDQSKEDLVLHGRQTPLWDKRKSSRGRRQRTYSVDNYRQQTSLTDPESSQSSSLQAPSTTSSYTGAASQGDVSSCSSPPPPPAHPSYSMHKSVSFTPRTLNGGGGGLVNGDTGTAAHSDSDHSGSHSSGLAKPPHESQWYTHPVHLEKKGFGLLETNPANGTVGGAVAAGGAEGDVTAVSNVAVAEDTSNKLHNGSSSNGHHHHHHHRRHRSSSARRSKSAGGGSAGESATSSTSSIDTLVREFFPLTLGAAYMLNSIPPSSKTLSPPPKPLPQSNSTPWKVGTKPRSKSPSRKRQSRPGSAHSSSSSASRNSLDRMYFLTAEAPHTAGVSSGGTVLLSSPYQSELARLRMDRLRIEEEHLLEVKRNDELERIRGPQPKWYELKSPRFHYEAKKNNELLKNKPQWQELMDYRADLERASKEYRKSFTPSPGPTTQPPGLSSTS